jgi:hypothetical protein
MDWIGFQRIIDIGFSKDHSALVFQGSFGIGFSKDLFVLVFQGILIVILEPGYFGVGQPTFLFRFVNTKKQRYTLP